MLFIFHFIENDRILQMYQNIMKYISINFIIIIYDDAFSIEIGFERARFIGPVH